MRATDLWEVRKIHSAMAYNDNDDYAIFNAKGRCIVKIAYHWNELNEIVSEHNKCFVGSEEEQS